MVEPSKSVVGNYRETELLRGYFEASEVGRIGAAKALMFARFLLIFRAVCPEKTLAK